MHQRIGKKKNIITYLILLFILSTTSGKYAISQNNHSSTINNINIEGLSSVENLRIFNELNDLSYKNILFADKKEITKIINKYNIIGEYIVKRIYPSTINIQIKPTKYLAKSSNDNQILVGANGKLIKDKKNNERLPYIFGEFNSTNFLTLKRNIEQSKFTFKELKTLYFFQSNRWDVLTNNDILIRLPRDNSLGSLNLAYKIISSDEFKKKTIIDLRVKDHLIIK